MIKRFFNWLFGIKHPSSTDFTPQQTDSSPSVVETILVKPTISVIQEQQIDFSRENNLIREGVWDEPPSIVNGDGTVFYKTGDKRNTYDPNKTHKYEDYDGTIREYGGSGSIKAVPEPPDEKYSDEVNNDGNVTEYYKKDREWQRKNRQVDFKDFIEKPRYTIGIDYGGDDGNTFSICVLRDGQVLESFTKHDEEDFKKEVIEMVNFYKMKDNLIFLMEKHEKFNNVKPVLEWSM